MNNKLCTRNVTGRKGSSKRRRLRSRRPGAQNNSPDASPVASPVVNPNSPNYVGHDYTRVYHVGDASLVTMVRAMPHLVKAQGS
jgi:hypothetical protein